MMEIPADILPTDPEERKRVEAAWAPLVQAIPTGGSMTLCILEAGETLVSLKLGERDGWPVAYMTKTKSSGKTVSMTGKWQGNA
jgi:hypothetical protein